MVVTFFGNKSTPSNVYTDIYATVKNLIENHNATVFLVGNEGAFDKMVRKVLQKLSIEFPYIKYTVELAYLPWKKAEHEDYFDCSYSEVLDRVPKKFAIDRRNRNMLECADIVVTYVAHPGGASKFKDLAIKKGKTVIELK